MKFLKAWSIISPILIYYLVNTAVFTLCTYLVLGISTQSGDAQIWGDWIRAHSVIVSGAVNGIAMLAAAAVVWKSFLQEKPQIRLAQLQTKDVPLVFILGGSAALCFNSLFSLVQITGSSQAYTEVAEKQFALPLWAGILLYGVISPIAEEIVFRGLVYHRLYRHFGRAFAIIGSAVLFGVYHGNFVQALYGFILGLLIAVIYERYASFVIPVLLHSAANISVYIVSSDKELTQRFMNWSGCIVCGGLSLLLFWLLVLRKEKNKNE